MYSWIYKLKRYIENNLDQDFFNHPATESELCKLEDFLKVKLPDSYKAFLKICNGTKLSSMKVFSINEIINFHQEFGFEPFEGTLEFCKKNLEIKDYYSNKPMHFLVFARMDSLNYCFDTRELIKQEYPICVYEFENQLDETLKVYSKGFDRFILSEIKALSDWWEMPDSWYEKESFFERIESL